MFCDEIARRVPQEACDDYKRLAGAATRGLAAFNAPNPMRRGETVTLQLVIGQTPRAAGSPTPMEVVKGLPGTATAFAPQVGRFMKAELIGAGFDIQPQAKEIQEVTPDGLATWEWRVTAKADENPKPRNRRTLTLKTAVMAPDGAGGYVTLRSTPKDQEVVVEVSAWDQALDLVTLAPRWIKSLTAVVVAVTTLAAAGFGLRKALGGGEAKAG